MPRKRTPDTVAAQQRQKLRELRTQIDDLEARLDTLREQRRIVLLDAKAAGATGHQLAADAGMTRGNMLKAMARQPATGGRTHSTVNQ